MGKILRFAQNDILWNCHPESFGRTQDKLREGSAFEIESLLSGAIF
jgi:hypothetical protein